MEEVARRMGENASRIAESVRRSEFGEGTE
jgi:hypothetical protein